MDFFGISGAGRIFVLWRKLVWLHYFGHMVRSSYLSIFVSWYWWRQWKGSIKLSI